MTEPTADVDVVVVGRRTGRQHGGARSRSGRRPGGAGRQGDVRARTRPAVTSSVHGGWPLLAIARPEPAGRTEGRRDGRGRANRATGVASGASGPHLSRPRRRRHPPAVRRLAARCRRSPPARAVTGRVAGIRRRWRVELDDGDAASTPTSSSAPTERPAHVAAAAGLVDPGAVLWGFAQRAYVAARRRPADHRAVGRAPGRGFPGYGWLFPGDAGAANVGLGLGLGADRSAASRAVTRFDAFCDHLRRPRPADRLRRRPSPRRLAEDGDRRHLARPRARCSSSATPPAWSTRFRARASLRRSPAAKPRRSPCSPARRRGSCVSTVDRCHVRRLDIGDDATPRSARRSPQADRRVVGIVDGPCCADRLIASTWAIYWNDLVDGATKTPAVTAAAVVHRIGLVMTRAAS